MPLIQTAFVLATRRLQHTLRGHGGGFSLSVQKPKQVQRVHGIISGNISMALKSIRPLQRANHVDVDSHVTLYKHHR
jgi:hypothetical protein